MNILRRPAHWVQNIIAVIIKGGAYAGMTVLILMMLITVAEVILRYAFNRPIFGSIEIVSSMLVTVAFLSIAYCALEDGNVNMDYIVSRLPPRGQRAFEITGYILCLALTIPMTCRYLPEVFYAHRIRLSSEVLDIPAFPFYIIIFFSCLMLSLVLLIKLVKSVAGLVK
jgi:TRAP-type C4-dicarboxylate transport system permease small subunit